MPRTEPSLMVCERCGKVHRWSLLAPNAVARCVRCDAVLGRGHRLGRQALLALNVAALVVFVIANCTEIITLRLRGAELSATFPQAVAAAWNEGEPVVAVIAAITALVAPALFIALRLYILLPLAAGRVVPGFAFCLRALHQVSRWNTVEVLTVAALLSLVRIAALAQASAGPALFALGTLALLLAAIESAGLRHLWWHVP
jgi:paraquat-inducible protein A